MVHTRIHAGSARMLVRLYRNIIGVVLISVKNLVGVGGGLVDPLHIYAMYIYIVICCNCR